MAEEDDDYTFSEQQTPSGQAAETDQVQSEHGSAGSLGSASRWRAEVAQRSLPDSAQLRREP
eukprot:15463832-Alexandrium_andersonii.AAC.1